MPQPVTFYSTRVKSRLDPIFFHFFSYLKGQEITFSSTSIAGHPDTFTGWSGACSGTGNCTKTINGDLTIIANFGHPPTLTSDCSSAAPREALPLVDFPTTTVNPTDNPVVVGTSSEVTVQPTMQVPGADVGQTASLIMYIYLPDLGFGINIPSQTATLSAETLCALLPNPINLSTAAGLSFYVYYGYVIGANIKYTAYSVVVDPTCVNDCQSITDKTICNANPNCTYQAFPTPQCVWNCKSYKTETTCKEAFGGNVCGWNDIFSNCAPIQ